MNTETGEVVDYIKLGQMPAHERSKYIEVKRDLSKIEELNMKIKKYSPCGCGSGLKFKFCCFRAAVLFVLLAVFSGCASIHQKATVTATNPTTGLIETRTTTSDISTLGTAKTVVASVSAKNTKSSQIVGAVGVDQQTSLAELIQLMGIMSQLMRGGAMNSPALVPGP